MNMINWNSIAEKLKEADAILIRASNGLSIWRACICLRIMWLLRNCLGTSNGSTDCAAFCRV